MINTQNKPPQNNPLKHDELILVVKREIIFADGSWQGIKETSFQDFAHVVNTHKEFHPRSLMETDPRYKQVVPYLIFKHQDSYFVMQRQAYASEQRLKNKYSIGIGGHIRQEDIQSTDIMQWAEREFHEEVSYAGDFTIKHIGLLNDDSSPVGEVHLGCVMLLEGTSPDIQIKSELKSGVLMSVEECMQLLPHMEQWSQTLFEHLTR